VKRRFLQEPHSVTSQKTAFFIVTTVITCNLIYLYDDITLEPIIFLSLVTEAEIRPILALPAVTHFFFFFVIWSRTIRNDHRVEKSTC
jgi:hypothetical protein